jgi:hypothetical protein
MVAILLYNMAGEQCYIEKYTIQRTAKKYSNLSHSSSKNLKERCHEIFRAFYLFLKFACLYPYRIIFFLNFVFRGTCSNMICSAPQQLTLPAYELTKLLFFTVLESTICYLSWKLGLCAFLNK